MRRVSVIGALLLLLTSASAALAAERLVVSLSTQRVLINSVFSGAELVLFGAIERDANAPERRFGYDIAAIVSGPTQSLLTLRKEQVGGIWVNVESRTFVNVPSYLAIFANRPFDQISRPELLRRLHIGFDNTILRQQIGPDVADVVRGDAFRQAFLRLKVQRRLYMESPKAVTFLAPTLFRASIPLPADFSRRRCFAPRSRCRPTQRSAAIRSMSCCSPTARWSRARPRLSRFSRSGSSDSW